MVFSYWCVLTNYTNSNATARRRVENGSHFMGQTPAATMRF
jgi:hypothetical protein